VSRRHISEPQANAEALARRGSPYATEHGTSAYRQADYRRRLPRNLREAVRAVRAAYADEVPTKLHEGPDSIGEDGTPKMTARATGYIFGNPQASDGDEPVTWYHSPFRATLSMMANGDESRRRHAAIVSHVTIGGQSPVEAAMAEGVPSWCAGLVGEFALTAFLNSLSGMKVTVPAREDAA
jgi:hypothetical protein